MRPPVKNTLTVFVLFIIAAVLLPAGCSRVKDRWRQVSGTRAPDADLEGEATTPPEATQEEVVIEGKTMVRSRNPYYLTMPNEPEYVYAEKGKELKTLQGMIENSIARRLGLTKETEGKGVPEAQGQGDGTPGGGPHPQGAGPEGLLSRGKTALCGDGTATWQCTPIPTTPGAWKGRTTPCLRPWRIISPSRKTSGWRLRTG